MKKILRIIIIAAALLVFAISIFAIFYDEAVLVRKGTFYAGNSKEKLVALTFDDGPSLDWTPKILDALKRADIKATFFMLGAHVKKYPDIARLVVRQGHEVENHSYSHHVLLYYKPEELKKEIKDNEQIIREITGITTRYFRPPKAWVTKKEKKIINDMGYKIVLWSLNSKDWVRFDDKYVVRYIVKNIRPGDILLFHDSGGVMGTEGGNREETVKTIPRLVKKLHQMGYKFVTVEEMFEQEGRYDE